MMLNVNIMIAPAGGRGLLCKHTSLYTSRVFQPSDMLLKQIKETAFNGAYGCFFGECYSKID